MRRSALLALLAIAAIAGCGGGSGTTSTGSADSAALTAPTTTQATTASAPPPAVRHKVAQAQPQFGPASAVPRTHGGDNSIQDFGQEAGQADRAAAARVLTTYLSAISTGDAKTACALLASTMTQRLQQLGQSAPGGAGGCPALVARLTSSMPAQLKRQLGDARVLSVRVDGDRGFIIFDGVGGKVSNMPLVKEAGQWKVAAVGPIPLQY